MAGFTYTLNDYPRVIEPSVSVLEVQIDRGAGPRRAHLMRLDPVQVHAAVVTAPSTAVHMFGDYANVDKCTYIVAYGTDGLMSAVFVRDDPGWRVHTAAIEDVNGVRPTLPSLRMVFNNARERDLFVYYLRLVQNGQITNTSVATALAGLAEDIRIIDVVPTSA